jgi:hypothetical protein
MNTIARLVGKMAAGGTAAPANARLNSASRMGSSCPQIAHLTVSGGGYRPSHFDKWTTRSSVSLSLSLSLSLSRAPALALHANKPEEIPAIPLKGSVHESVKNIRAAVRDRAISIRAASSL